MLSRRTIWLLTAAFAGLVGEANVARSQEKNPPAGNPPKTDAVAATPELKEPHKAVERALEFITKDAVKWRKEHGCVSCHHGTMTVWALAEAKSQGYVVDAQTLDDAIWQTKGAIVPVFSKPRDPRPPPWNVVNYPSLYLGVMSHNLPILSRDETHRLAEHLARHQEEDGAWLLRPPGGSGTPPTSESRETIALLALLAWEPYVPDDPKAAAAAREKALKWLRETKSTDTNQALALRLLLDVRMGTSPAEVQARIDKVLAAQRPDGGWGQVPEMASDAYATGQSLWALSFAGVKHDRPEVVRAVSFLAANQRADGSWPMAFRSHPGAEATHERKQVPIVYFGAAWATLGLVRSVPPVLDPAAREKQAISAIVAINGKVGRNETEPDKPVTFVDIASGTFDDEELAQMVIRLAAFPKLTSLKVRDSKVTDAGLVHLKKLPQLTELSLEVTAITDAGLAHLKELTRLETLNLKGTKVTDAGVQDFQKAMPKTKVER